MNGRMNGGGGMNGDSGVDEKSERGDKSRLEKSTFTWTDAVPHKSNLLPSAQCSIISCPFSGGQPKAGVDKGPDALIQAGLDRQISALGWKVDAIHHLEIEDCKPAPGEEFTEKDGVGKMKNTKFVGNVVEKVSRLVASSLRLGSFPLTLGGDHSLAIGTVLGVQSVYPDACLIWIDAHTDINTPLTTDSGNIHGCPVSFLMNLDEASSIPPFNRFLPQSPAKSVLSPDRIAYIGLRSVDPPERAILKALGICAFSMYDIDRHGIGRVVEMALERVNPYGKRAIHLSFDVDSLDPTVAPSTGTPVRGGLTMREGHYICERLYQTGQLVAMDLMEVNPTLGTGHESVEQTLNAACSLARCALGRSSADEARERTKRGIVDQERNLGESLL